MKKRKSHWTSGNHANSSMVPVILILGVAAVLLQLLWVRQNKEMFAENQMRYQFENILPSQIRRVQCGLCSGTGVAEYPAHSGQIGRCPKCLGVGFRDVRLLDPMDAICPECGGMGRSVDAETGVIGPCPTCDGRGLVVLPPNRLRGAERHLLEVECPVCDGLGTIKDADEKRGYRLCPVCFGLGKNHLRKLSDSDQLCNVCQGMGRCYDKSSRTATVCTHCGGSGLIDAPPSNNEDQ